MVRVLGLVQPLFCYQGSIVTTTWVFGYLTYVVGTQDEERVSVSDVLVVREFLDVFIEDLPSVPPIRKV